MVSAFSHAVSAVAIGSVIPRDVVPKRLWVLGAVCAALPDLDALAHWSGVSYDSMFGHRGITHSVAFGLFWSALIVFALSRSRWRAYCNWTLFGYLAVCTAIHGVLDALTSGGNGIALAAPFTAARYWLPWNPISVAPISISGFFTQHGWSVFKSELTWVWLPCAVIFALSIGARFARSRLGRVEPGKTRAVWKSVIPTAVAIAGLVVFLFLFAGRQRDAGERVLVESIYLARDGKRLTDADKDEVRALLAAVEPDLSAAFSKLATATVIRARKEPTSSDLSAALERLQASQIQLVWEADFPRGDVTYGSSFMLPSMRGGGFPPLDSGKTIFARVQARVVPWPTGKNYTPHPEILLAQTRVWWWSAEPDGPPVAEALAKEAIAELERRVIAKAREHGLEASLEPIGR